MKYKCINCGNVFDAEPHSELSCPSCNSYNVAVQPASNNKYLMLLGIFAAVIVACVVALFLIPKPSDKVVADNSGEEYVSPETPKTSDITPVTSANLPLTFIEFNMVEEPQYTAKTKTWAFKVQAKLNRDTTAKIEYAFIDRNGEYKNSFTGAFKGVKVDGETVTIIAKIEGDTIKAIKDFTGFKVPENAVAQEPDKPEPAVQGKVTMAEVQGWVNDLKDSSKTSNPLLDTRGNTRVSPKCKYTINGLNDEDKAKGLAHPRADKIQEKFEYDDWGSITVTAIGFDNSGMLNSVTGTLTYK